MLQAAAGAAMVPSTQRPIPLEVRGDLVFERIDYLGIAYGVIKDPVALKYFRLQPEQEHVLRLMDGKRSLEQIRDELHVALPTVRLQLTDIQHLITDLHQKGLVYSNRAGQGVAMIKQDREAKKKKIFAAARNLLYLRLPGWDPEPTLQWLYPLVRWIFFPWTVALTIAFVVASWILLAVQFEEFSSRLPEFQQFFGWPNLMYMWVTLAAAKILHEFGHGVSCKHFGGECHEMGIMLLVFSPTLYCDVSDSWVLKSKWKRIIIGAAGMYVEIFLSAVAVFTWWNTQPGLLNHLCLNIFFVTTVTTVIFNANPLMRFDGYYMMSDFLEIPNLRPKSDRLLRESFAWYCLGIESKPDPFMPETGRAWFVTYAIAAGIYRWFILFGITLFLYTVLKPYKLQSIGIALAVISMSSIVGNLIYQVYKTITAPRIEPMSKPKIAITVTAFVSVIAFGLSMPVPWHLESTFIVEPHDVHDIYTMIPGELVDVRVQPGQRVKQGDLLMVLRNEEKEDQYRSLNVQKQVQLIEVDKFHALDDLAQELLAREKLQTIQEQIDDYELQLKQQRITAPCDGVIVEPPRKPEPKFDLSQRELASWHGTPLSPRNLGSFLEDRLHVASVAPDTQYQATLLIDQGDRNELLMEQKIELKFEHLPDVTYEGTIDEISERHLEFVPQILSNKLGGELPTTTDSQGRERLQSKAYQATVLLDEDTPLLRSGMRGRARFLVDSRSAGGWLWRYINQTFRFRL